MTTSSVRPVPGRHVTSTRQRGVNDVARAPDSALLSVRRVFKKYRSKAGADVVALADVSVAVRNGEVVSIVGPSGCGKSTLLMIAAGLVRPTAGSVCLDNKEIHGPHPGLGVAFQRDCLLEWRNVRDNILAQIDLRGWKRGPYQARVDQLLDVVGLTGQDRRYPKELSGGMRQRVSLCRALVHEPEVLLLDEPFGALDALTRERINVDVSALCTRWHNAVVLVTHDISEAVFMGDRVIVMATNPGRVVSVVDVPLAHPRSISMRGDPVYSETVSQIRATLVESGAYGP